VLSAVENQNFTMQETEKPEGEEKRNDDARPLSYADLRRFFFLVLSFAIIAALVGALGKVLLLFAIVIFVALVLNTPISWLQRKGVKRGLAVVLVMAVFIGVLGGLVTLMLPPILSQSNELVAKAPEYGRNIESHIHRLEERYPALDKIIPETDVILSELEGYVRPAASWLLLNTVSLVSKLFLFIIGVLLTIFIVSNPAPLVAGVLGATPARHREAMWRTMIRVRGQMAAWAKATIIMGAITGVSTGVLLHFVGVQPALLFGALAAFGELIPNIGPVVVAAPALFVAAGVGPTTFFYALAAILFVQQIESNVLVPFVMGTQMELHPLSIIFFALAMGSLFGIAGAILAVPTAAIIKIIYDEFYLRPNHVPVTELEVRAKKITSGEDDLSDANPQD
jgi:predicted PurR-regulated permease PerM